MMRPEQDEGPTVAAAGPQVVAQSVSLHSATSSAEEKAFQTLRARLALAGHALSRMDDGDGPSTYYVTRWGLVRELRDLGAVEAFAKQVGGPIHG